MENPIIFAGENPDDMKYPIGIQTFTKLREDDSAYVDKTAMVYKLAREGSKGAEEALQQIEDKQYAAPFKADPRKLFKIGVCFSSEERGIKDWKTA